MTPREKSKELVDKFIYLLPCEGLTTTQTPIDCALISVDEIIDSYTKEKSYGYIVSDKIISYWEQVKEEIKKL